MCDHSSVSVYRCGGEQAGKDQRQQGKRRVKKLSETERAAQRRRGEDFRGPAILEEYQ